MRPTKPGQIAKFHTPLPDENPNQLYVVLEIIEDNENSRANIQALNTGLKFPGINKVSLDDLEVVEVNTQDLIGHSVTIKKPNHYKVEGRVINVSQQKINLDLTKENTGIETNVLVTIVDKNGLEHVGTIFVK